MQQGNLAIRSSAGGEGSRESKRGREKEEIRRLGKRASRRRAARGRRGPHGKRSKRWGATQGLPKRSPILVLLSPKRVSLRSSDGIRCISAGMIATGSGCTRNCYKRFGAPAGRATGRCHAARGSAIGPRSVPGGAGPDRQPKRAITCDPTVGSRPDFYSGLRRPFSL